MAYGQNAPSCDPLIREDEIILSGLNAEQEMSLKKTAPQV